MRCIAAFSFCGDLLILSACETRALVSLLNRAREGLETQHSAVLRGLQRSHSRRGVLTRLLSIGVVRRFSEVVTHQEMVFALLAVPQIARLANLVQLTLKG
jgi:hypothetical protein